MHRPRWFSAETESDTGERVWSPARMESKLEYWAERERIWREKMTDTSKVEEWKEVDRIFIDDEP